MGLFAAINNDTTTVGLGWDVILQAMGVDPAPRVLDITPAVSDPTRADAVDFTVRFSKPVTNFTDASDLAIIHRGTASAGVVVAGDRDTYNVRVTGITGQGLLMFAVSTTSDVADLEAHALLSSVTSVPVFIDTPYRVWAAGRGLVRGANDGFADDPDSDGWPNLKEFALDGAPLGGANDDKQRALIEQMDGTNYITYTFPVRNGPAFVGNGELSASVDGIGYSIAGSFDLLNFDQPMLEQVPASELGLPALNPGWTYRTFRLDQAISTRTAGFIRLRIGPGGQSR